MMPRRRSTMPPDFPKFAPHEGNLRLRKRFGVGGVTVEMWRRQLGVRYNPPPPKVVPRSAVKRRAKRFASHVNEQIEELEDFGTSDIARSLDLRFFDLDW